MRRIILENFSAVFRQGEACTCIQEIGAPMQKVVLSILRQENTVVLKNQCPIQVIVIDFLDLGILLIPQIQQYYSSRFLINLIIGIGNSRLSHSFLRSACQK